MTWEIVYTLQAELDLQGIYEYIAYSLLEPETARKQSERIMDEIQDLSHMPYRYALHEKEPWHSKGLRFLTVNNYVVFYFPDEDSKSVGIIRIFYGGSNIEEHLDSTASYEKLFD